MMRAMKMYLMVKVIRVVTKLCLCVCVCVREYAWLSEREGEGGRKGER